VFRPSQLYIKRNELGSWEFEGRNPSHNHDADENLAGHPIARCRTERQVSTVWNYLTLGSEPRVILSVSPQDDPETLLMLQMSIMRGASFGANCLQAESPVQHVLQHMDDN
jgi:hypothetical protein